MKLLAEAPQEEEKIGPHGQPIYNGLPEHRDAQFMEAKMIKLLENRGFRYALNLFRFVRRSVGIQDYTEELFFLFIQSAIRLGKMDVVEYMLNSMAEIPKLVAPSQHFWRATLKHLSSQTEFEACLLAHDIFGSKIALDIVVFQCLMTAELKMGVPEHARKVLKRLVHRDGVLQEPRAILINHVLCCVREEQPKLALQALREAQALDKSDGPERIVNLRSYNTAIRGLARKRNSSMSVEVFNELVACGLEPDEDTCRMVIDCCVKTGNMEAAREIETSFEITLMPPSKS
jgi:pentatricopeptide repeat protein